MGKSFVHHEYARLFPMLDDEAIQELADDIAKNGLRNPIVIDQDDQILDGRNRAAACAIAGVEPIFEPFIGTDEEKLAFVVSANVHRRHLTTSQRASVAAKLLPIYEAQAAKRQQATQRKGNKPVPENLPEPKSKGDSRDKAGAAMNVSGKSVDMAEKVHAKAIPEITAAVDRGEVAVSAAAIVADMPAEEQKQLASKGPKAIREAAAKARKPTDDAEDDHASFDVNAATSRLCDRARTMITAELCRWPDDLRSACLDLFSGVVEEFK